MRFKRFGWRWLRVTATRSLRSGGSLNDLGATIVAPDADLNLGIKTFLNGALVSDIVLDTSEAATDTIDYVVTDPTGLTATSTRTVIIDEPSAPSTVPDYNPSTTLPAATASPASTSPSEQVATSSVQ